MLCQQVGPARRRWPAGTATAAPQQPRRGLCHQHSCLSHPDDQDTTHNVKTIEIFKTWPSSRLAKHAEALRCCCNMHGNMHLVGAASCQLQPAGHMRQARAVYFCLTGRSVMRPRRCTEAPHNRRIFHAACHECTWLHCTIAALQHSCCWMSCLAPEHFPNCAVVHDVQALGSP